MKEKLKEPGISIFQRYLTLWVLLCMVLGVLIGKYLPAVPAFLNRFEYAKVSIPMAILIWLMIYPMMMRVDFQSIKNVGKSPKGLFVTWVTNWLIKPFSMYGMQNCPRKDNDPVGIRSMIVAPEGCVLLSLDFSQIELRVGAFYCRDEKMLQTYRDGGDIHAQTTSVIYGIPFEQAVDKNAEHYKERRTIAKNCNFGVFFGLFPRGLQKTLKFKAGLDTPLSDCERIIANLKSGYPQLSLWQEVVKRQAAARRYSETWLGRRRYLPNITSEDWGKKSFAERCAMNTPMREMWRKICSPPAGKHPLCVAVWHL